VEWALAVFAIGLVLTAELFNTAVESLVDMISPDYSQKAGFTKDVAAGAVLIAAVVSAIIGCIIFIPKII
jgi:diacylglycerol kinase